MPQKRKRCCRCKQLKLLDSFAKTKTGKHGVFNYCRECAAEYMRSRNPRRADIDEAKALRAGLRRSGLKRCSACKQIKPLNEFHGDARHSDGKQSRCKECVLARASEGYLRREYGLTLGEYEQLMEAQDGRCAICGRPPKNNRFNVDHCHSTHRVRALLCVNCNTNLLPMVERFSEWVRRAFEYLERPPAIDVLGERVVPETNQARMKERKAA